MDAVIRAALPGILGLLLLSACSSSAPVRYYSMQPIDSDFHPDPDDSLMLGLGPLRMPEYLNRSQIVWRGDNAEIRVDDYNRWSEPLNDTVLRIVSRDVDNLLLGVVVVVFPYETFVRDQVDYRLVGDINRFEADSGGRVRLDVQWSVVDANSKTLVSVRRNSYQAQATNANDPGAVVMAMNDALAQFSRDIAEKLKPLL